MEMQKFVIPSSSTRLPALPFGEFLATLFQALDKEGVRFSVLRNYEGFPAINLGSDVDFLIRPSDLPLAIRALRSVQGTRIVGYSERPSSVAITFLEGVSPAPGQNALQVDFNMNFSWKGLPILRVEAVLQAAVPRQTGNLNFLVPSSVHEAIISLLSSLLVGGWLKEKYFPRVQQTFAINRSEVIAALLPPFGLEAATQLVDSVIGGDRGKILGCVRTLRIAMALRSLLHSPLLSAFALPRHYASEFAVRFSPKTLETVCVLGPTSCGEAAIIEGLIPLLKSTAKVVEKRPPWQQQPFGCDSIRAAASTDSRDEAPRGSFDSMTNAALWLMKEWLRLFKEKKNLTLQISDSSCYDLFLHPQNPGSGNPEWFRRLASRLIPPRDLWIFLDPAADAIQHENQASPGQVVRQLEACRAFVKLRKKYVILDANKPLAAVTEEAYAAIIDVLAQRANRKLKIRFS